MLYIVATPIGNLEELTHRAVNVLSCVDYILCEDTRTSIKLTQHYNIKKPLVSYHKFNEKSRLQEVVSHLNQGKDIALISDSGMPGVSDPGTILVQECIKQDLPFTVVSGANAAVNAFVLSGYNPPFTFMGFLPHKTKDQKALLENYKNVKGCLIFYVSPHSIEKTFEVLLRYLGDRECFVARELTKKFEEKQHTTLKQGYTKTIKGEFVLVVSGRHIDANNNIDAKTHVEKLMKQGISKNEAIKQTAKLLNVKKNEVYQLMV